MAGPLALVGGAPFTDGCTFDRELVEASGGREVLVLPTGAAFEHPARLVERAASWFGAMGTTSRGLGVLGRPDAFDAGNAAAVRAAGFVYLAGDSPMHLRSVLKDTPVWEALVEAWRGGAVLAAAGGGAMVLCDPMVDPRGGAFTVGLGLVRGITVVPEFERWSAEVVHRTRRLSPADLVMIGLPSATAVLRDAGGAWAVAGVGEVSVFRGGEPAMLGDLPASVEVDVRPASSPTR
ncbi:MAG: Type 1 glutamine amidotransferase-like domain-containing protein [Actinobacteria bacterium]|nr:Type 1 glutamine amidotransferase-like domain-containing protein [Actinomycetota bacterium]